jgi:hypothetical protein
LFGHFGVDVTHGSFALSRAAHSTPDIRRDMLPRPSRSGFMAVKSTTVNQIVHQTEEQRPILVLDGLKLGQVQALRIKKRRMFCRNSFDLADWHFCVIKCIIWRELYF